jgi:hypothetical protein
LVAYSLMSSCLRSALIDIGLSLLFRGFGQGPGRDVVQHGRLICASELSKGAQAMARI